jgi:hypothetical protein
MRPRSSSIDPEWPTFERGRAELVRIVTPLGANSPLILAFGWRGQERWSVLRPLRPRADTTASSRASVRCRFSLVFNGSLVSRHRSFRIPKRHHESYSMAASVSMHRPSGRALADVGMEQGAMVVVRYGGMDGLVHNCKYMVKVPDYRVPGLANQQDAGLALFQNRAPRPHITPLRIRAQPCLKFGHQLSHRSPFVS